MLKFTGILPERMEDQWKKEVKIEGPALELIDDWKARGVIQLKNVGQN